MEKTPSELQIQDQASAASEYIYECLINFSDKKILWLAEEASKIHSYDRSKKQYPPGYYKLS